MRLTAESVLNYCIQVENENIPKSLRDRPTNTLFPQFYKYYQQNKNIIASWTSFNWPEVLLVPEG
jgi:hypothetical protein